jgi:hypothetical protein
MDDLVVQDDVCVEMVPCHVMVVVSLLVHERVLESVVMVSKNLLNDVMMVIP